MGAALGLIGVAAGAFGAHALRDRLGADLLQVFEIGVRYQMYHALTLVALGLLAARVPGPSLHLAGWLFFVGVVIFSGSLYALSLTGVRWLGAITPLGGVCLLAGWACLLWAAWAGSEG